jgi:protein-arginine kinase
MLYTQPGHMQKVEGRAINPDERDEVRARLVREAIRRAVLREDGQESDRK